ncbi:FMN-dependent NADH-azoreductase [Lactiplantibacillus daowaiensis]|uniref:FMN dependent NADH:quinone oxidoreductase n=1 Tax=Lactiplantibacillus daowaiensis TaxID=2559918 RepID=A0ABW1RZD8_9LACO|nr:NAD(P)H-dependent oxidoreductase [Lactiplantibacillus daowaiensis]
MTKLLMIMAHPHTTVPSKSLQVADQFKASYQAAHPDDEIIVRDLFTTPVPPLNDTTFAAWLKVKANRELTSAEQAQLSQHQQWLAEFIGADKYVFVNPMYNHFLPAELKQYIDVTAVARQTFKYTPAGPVGLLTHKKALHIQAAGGLYHDAGEHGDFQQDFGATYLTKTLQLYGVTDQSQLFIEGADRYPERHAEIMQTALAQAEQFGKTF